MQKSSKNEDRIPMASKLATTAADGFDSPESRGQIAAAGIILAADPTQETRTVLYGREKLEEIARSGVSQDAMVVTFEVDSASETRHAGPPN